MKKQSNSIPDSDRGFNYGDGLFETILVNDYKPILLDEHLSRLARGANRLGIEFEQAHVKQLIINAAKESAQQIIKLVLTRGCGDRGYNPHTSKSSAVYLSKHKVSNTNFNAGVKVYNCSTRMASQPLLAGIKHLNRLEQVLARGEWDDSGFAEGLMQDYNGNYISGTMSNLFIVKGKSFITPCLENCGVEGVMRSYILNVAQEFGLSTLIKDIQLQHLQAADEVFLTNSVFGIWPVLSLTDIFAKSVGKVTKSLQYVLHRRLGYEN